MQESDRDRLDGRALRDRRTRGLELVALLVAIAIGGYFLWRIYEGLDL